MILIKRFETSHKKALCVCEATAKKKQVSSHDKAILCNYLWSLLKICPNNRKLSNVEMDITHRATFSGGIVKAFSPAHDRITCCIFSDLSFSEMPHLVLG